MIWWMAGFAAATPSGWVREGSKDFVIGGAPGRHGGRALVLENTAGTRAEHAAATQTVDPKPYQGRLVRLSAWVRARGEGAMFFVVVNDGQQVLAMDREEVRSHGWTRVVAAVPVPEGGDRLRFGVALQGKGAVWLDDLELEVLTDLEVDMDQPFAVQAPLASPVNLDLEGA